MRCRFSEMCWGWGVHTFFKKMDKRRKKSLSNLLNMYYSVSDHYFCCIRYCSGWWCSWQMSACKNRRPWAVRTDTHPWASRILSRIETFICDLRGCGEKFCVSGLGGLRAWRSNGEKAAWTRDQWGSPDPALPCCTVLEMIVPGDSEESYMPSEGNAWGQESFRYRILSKEMAGAHMEKERSGGRL